jgi:hypothetical protein
MAVDQSNLPDDSDDDSAGPVAGQVQPGSVVPSTGALPAPAPMNPVLQQYLQNKQQMQAAQAKVDSNNTADGYARAGASLFAGLSGSNKPVDNAPFDAMAKTSQQPVQNVLDAQKSQATDLSNQAAAMNTSKLAQNQDPTSPQSVAAKNLIQKLYPGKFKPEDLDTLSAADLGDSIMKPLELDEKIKEHSADMAAQSEARRSERSDRNQDKKQALDDKYITHIEDKEAGWRSDPASTRFDAMLGATSAGKTLIDKYRGREDKMPIQEIHALVADRLKALTGATPTETEIAAQMPHTGSTTWGGVKSYFTGKPEAANAGGFVKNIDEDFKLQDATAYNGLMHRQQTVASDPRLPSEQRSRIEHIGVPIPAYGIPSQNQPSSSPAQGPQGISPDLHASVEGELARRAALKRAGK